LVLLLGLLEFGDVVVERGGGYGGVGLDVDAEVGVVLEAGLVLAGWDWDDRVWYVLLLADVVVDEVWFYSRLFKSLKGTDALNRVSKD
jgi:hypothetical protein